MKYWLNTCLTFFCRVSTQSVTATHMFPLLALSASRASNFEIVPDQILMENQLIVVFKKYTPGTRFNE